MGFRRLALPAAALVAFAAPASAQPPAPADALQESVFIEDLPPPVQAMIEDALANGSDAEIAAIIRFARRAYPREAQMLDRRVVERRDRLAAARREELLAAGPIDNWHGRGEIGATLTTGSTDNLGVYASVEARREGLSWNHQFRARANIQEASGVRTQEQFLAAYEPRYNVNERLQVYGLAQYERDPFLGFDGRYTVSVGLGYQLVNNRTLAVNIQGGPALRIEQPVIGTAREGVAGRGALDARLQLRPGLRLTQTASAFLDIEGGSFASATGLEAQLIGQLSARLSYTVQYEDRPLTGVRNTDTQSRVSFVYGF